MFRFEGMCGGPARCDRRWRDCRPASRSYPQASVIAGLPGQRRPERLLPERVARRVIGHTLRAPSRRPAAASTRPPLTAIAITRSNVRLFHIETPHHETHVPTLRRQAQAHARFSRPDEERGRPQGAFGAPREGPRPARSLISESTAAMAERTSPLQAHGRRRVRGVFRTGRRSEGEFLQLVSVRGSARVRARRIRDRQQGAAAGGRPQSRAPDASRRAARRRALRSSGLDVIVRVKRPVPRSEFARVVAEARRMLAVLPGVRESP